MKNSIGKNIRRIRTSKKITQKELSRLSGISQNSISNHENGNRKIDELDIEIYADALGVKPYELFDRGSTSGGVKPIPVKPIPVVSHISAGDPTYSEEDIEEYTYVPENMFKVGKDLFALRVSGDSMDKEFKENDLVIIEKDSVVENGQIGVVMINGYSATVKRVRYEEDKIYLIPESNNSSHLTQVYTSDDEVYIIGKVVSSQKFY